jgi:hypothetical protein
MSDIGELLFEAGQALARLSDPRRLEDAEDAARTVGRFAAAEEQVRWAPDAAATLRRWLSVPPEEQRPNHAFLAGLVLARWSPPGTAEALLEAARSRHEWCSRMARLNLGWLAPGRENRAVLESALEHATVDDVPAHLVADALAHQRDPAALPALVRYLEGPDDPANRAWVLIAVVALLPHEGRLVAWQLSRTGTGPLAVTATGLAAAYGDPDALRDLRSISSRRDTDWHTALYWLVRIPHPALQTDQVGGLEHPDPAVRADLVNGLALVGSRRTLEAVVAALSDEDRAVADTALAHVAQLIGPAFDEISWAYDEEGRLEPEGRDRLVHEAESVVASLVGGERFLFRQPMTPRHLIDLLYVGFLTSTTWINLVATTGASFSFSPRRNLLANLEAVHALEAWHHANARLFEPGGWYYAGEAVTAP